MKYKEYVKAFKFLSKRLRDLTQDSKAHLSITFNMNLLPTIVHISNPSALGYNTFRKYRYFVDSSNRYYIRGNQIKDLRIMRSSYAQYYSVGHRMNDFKKEDFMKMWLDNAIKNTLYISYHYDSSAVFKFLDANDTVESLCVQYDMTHI